MMDFTRGTLYKILFQYRNAKAKVATSLYDKNGVLTSDPKKVLDIQAQFYAKLYQGDPEFRCEIKNKPEKVITKDKRDWYERDITMEELQEAVKTMARNKSPGTDGFSVDLYVVFWQKLKDFLFEAMQFGLKEGILHRSAREGIISLIPKKDRDLQYVHQWRPIVLLNTDFKILSKVLANRLKDSLNDIIGAEQTGFVKGRQITENLRKLLDVIEYTEVEHLPGVLITIDFEKAFDKVQYPAVYKTLEWFNFGPKFIGKIKTLFEMFSMSTINNGYKSKPFLATKGLFQGNPIAPYLFILVIEILATKIRRNGKIKGIKVRDHDILLSLFADDLAILLDFDQRSWNELENIFSEYNSCTGMTINYNKTAMYRLGSLRYTNARFYSRKKLIWTDEPVKVLGVYLTVDQNKIISQNYDCIVQKCESIFKMWSLRGASLFGKILLINSLVASLFVYPFTVLPWLPDVYFRKINNLIRDFLWDGKRSKIPFEIIIGLKKDGGAGLTNLKNKEIALKLQWIFKLSEKEEMKVLAYELMQNPLGDLIWGVNLNVKDFGRKFKRENFWTGILKTWLKWTAVQPKTKEAILDQCLWYNSNIKINREVIFYRKWHKEGINFVKDLLDNGGQFIKLDKLCDKVKENVPFLVLEGIIKSIPFEWKKILKGVGREKEKESETDRYQELQRYEKPARVIYTMYCSNEFMLKRKLRNYV